MIVIYCVIKNNNRKRKQTQPTSTLSLGPGITLAGKGCTEVELPNNTPEPGLPTCKAASARLSGHLSVNRDTSRRSFFLIFTGFHNQKLSSTQSFAFLGAAEGSVPGLSLQLSDGRGRRAEVKGLFQGGKEGRGSPLGGL